MYSGWVEWEEEEEVWAEWGAWEVWGAWADTAAARTQETTVFSLVKNEQLGWELKNKKNNRKNNVFYEIISVPTVCIISLLTLSLGKLYCARTFLSFFFFYFFVSFPHRPIIIHPSTR